MSRAAQHVVWRESDDRFSVVVAARSDRPGYRVRSGFRGGRLDTRSAVSRDEAEAIGAGIWQAYQLGAIEAPEVAPETLEQLAARIDLRDDLTAKTRGSYRRVWSLLVRAVGASRALRRIYRLDVEAWLSTYTGQTRATYLRTVRAGFSWAKKKGWISTDPTEGIEARVEHELGPWLPSTDWRAYLDACQPAHRIRSAFALETGLRSGEICAARQAWIRRGVGRSTIVVAADPTTGFVPKWGRPRSVPLTARAEELLAEAAQRWHGPWLFSSDGLAQPNFARETAAACKRAKVGPTTFHGLRRSAGAHWLDCGVPLIEVSRLLGHASVTTTERWYAGVGEVTLVRAMAQVEEVERARAAVQSIGPSIGPSSPKTPAPRVASPANPRIKRA